MDIKKIVTELRSEREGIEKAIRALKPFEHSSFGRGGKVVSISKGKAKTGGRKPMSAATRKRLSESMKRRWAQRKARSRAA
jgi:hypothetical protein